MNFSNTLSSTSIYALYASMGTILIFSQKIALASVLLMTAGFGFASNHIQWPGLLVLSCYTGLLALTVFIERSDVKFIFSCFSLFLNELISLHKIPGFNNQMLISKEVISKNAIPYTLFINYDKSLAGAITLIAFGLKSSTKYEQSLSSIACTTLLMSLITIPAITIASLALGYVKPEFRMKRHLKKWIATNLLLTCTAEEALFRTQLQGNLVQNFRPQFALLIASMLFGIAHFPGGKKYIGLASLAGLDYGMTYQLTGDIRSSILLHFLLNFVHFIGFTYPALENSIETPASKLK